jgi:hypothetical protein
MAKVRDNRYQNVAELIEDLTIAAGMTIHRLGAVTNTGETTVRTDEPDEVTVVRPREVPPVPVVPVAPRRAPVTVSVSGAIPPPASAATGFNPLKVLIPSAVALLVVFAAIYALTRNSTPAVDANTNQQVPSLAADPNSQPVQPAQPATGKGEEGIPSGGSITPPANVNASPSASVEVSPNAIEDFTPSVNAPANANANTNENGNSNANSNRKAPALPEPTRSVVPETAPPPVVPSPTKPPAEKPSPTATPRASR